PPAVFIDLHGDGLKQPYNQRVLAGSLAVPCLLSPVLEETPDFLALFTREKTKRIQRFHLHTSLPVCFDEDALEVRFFTVGRPAPVSPNELRTVFPSDVYHDSPDEVQPADASINYYQGRRVQHLPAPASIRYQLVGDERMISMTIGVLDEAYLEGRTDGVMFTVELQQPGQPPEVINHRHLHPTTEPRDRGPQDFSAFLPPKFAVGSHLTLRCDPGPSGDTAWDWAFATSIKITRGDFRPEQFPGFQVLPSSTEGTSITRMGVGAETVLMMGPPSAVVLDLHEGQQQLNFTTGMLEGSYTSGETDGVAFHVELLHDDGRVQSVFNRWLQPKSIPADRGPQSFAVPLPPFEPGTRLRLRNDEGPHGNGSWDWAYVSQLSLK
ncbi:MAG TPA: hypothetical protein VL069_05295, partial [Opitutus sp.]|nr:hypothetical protein [Opitutus sp.]